MRVHGNQHMREVSEFACERYVSRCQAVPEDINRVLHEPSNTSSKNRMLLFSVFILMLFWVAWPHHR